MDIFGGLYRAAETVSAGKAAAIGGAGSGVSVATAALADPTMLGAIDIAATVPWLQVATLCIGLLTGVSSLALVLMKVVQQGRDIRG
jgi:hypothetical protein